MNDFATDYASADDPNKRYLLLREEAKRLRAQRPSIDFRGSDALKQVLRSANERIDGALIVFCANDFGLPRAYRPDGIDRSAQNRVRKAILANKYNSHEGLNEIRLQVLGADERIHKALVSVVRSDGDVRYHAPGGKTDETRFLTVREQVGLVDYVTNSSQAEGMSEVY